MRSMNGGGPGQRQTGVVLSSVLVGAENPRLKEQMGRQVVDCYLKKC